MNIYFTECKAPLAPLLYSDVEVITVGKCVVIIEPTFNQWARYPLLGMAAGFIRVMVAIAHIAFHAFMMLMTQDRGHMFHMWKGCAELLRGCIEMTPVLGRIFAMSYEPPRKITPEEAVKWAISSIFLVKIINPNSFDAVDVALMLKGNPITA